MLACERCKRNTGQYTQTHMLKMTALFCFPCINGSKGANSSSTRRRISCRSPFLRHVKNLIIIMNIRVVVLLIELCMMMWRTQLNRISIGSVVWLKWIVFKFENWKVPNTNTPHRLASISMQNTSFCALSPINHLVILSRSTIRYQMTSSRMCGTRTKRHKGWNLIMHFLLLFENLVSHFTQCDVDINEDAKCFKYSPDPNKPRWWRRVLYSKIFCIELLSPAAR